VKIFSKKPARTCPKFSKKLEKTAHHNPKSAPAFKLLKRKKTNPIPYLWAGIPTFQIPSPIVRIFMEN